MKITLYGIPMSHPVRCARLMLDYKGLSYRRIDLVNGPHAPVLRALGFPRGSAPALKIDGRKLQGTREISRELDRLLPEPALFPSDPVERAKVVEAERWGEEVLQPVGRLLAMATFKRDRSAIPGLTADAKLPLQLPPRTIIAASRVLVGIQSWRHGADDALTRTELERLPEYLDHVEALIIDGVIGHDRPNAADFQIATSLRVLTLFDDVRPALEGRPAGRFALRVAPTYPGRVPSVLPNDWLEALRAEALI